MECNLGGKGRHRIWPNGNYDRPKLRKPGSVSDRIFVLEHPVRSSSQPGLSKFAIDKIPCHASLAFPPLAIALSDQARVR